MSLPSSAGDPGPTNKQSVLLRPSSSGPSTVTPRPSVRTFGATLLRGGGFPSQDISNGGRQRLVHIGVVFVLHQPGRESGQGGRHCGCPPRPPSLPRGGRSPVHRGLDALVPCEGQSLLPGGRNTVIAPASHGDGQAGGRGGGRTRPRPPRAGVGGAPLRASPGEAHLDETLQSRQLRHDAANAASAGTWGDERRVRGQ